MKTEAPVVEEKKGEAPSDEVVTEQKAVVDPNQSPYEFVPGECKDCKFYEECVSGKYRMCAPCLPYISKEGKGWIIKK